MNGYQANIQQQTVELFFTKDAKNHPGANPGFPNWYFYWLQTVTPLEPANTITWKYGTWPGFQPGTTEITMSDIAAGVYSGPYGTNNPLKGIDAFAYIVRHESQHYADWVNFWSNNTTTWTNARGKEGPDDDKDADRIPNKIEDVNL